MEQIHFVWSHFAKSRNRKIIQANHKKFTQTLKVWGHKI
jgi:hypothetical protein